MASEAYLSVQSYQSPMVASLGATRDTPLLSRYPSGSQIGGELSVPVKTVFRVSEAKTGNRAARIFCQVVSSDRKFNIYCPLDAPVSVARDSCREFGAYFWL